MQRKFWAVALVTLALVGVVATHAVPARADPRDFVLLNGSDSLVITHLFVSPAEQADWGDDILGRDVLNPGESATVVFTRFDGSSCLYDIKVLGGGGEEGYLYGVDLCATATVTFS